MSTQRTLGELAVGSIVSYNLKSAAECVFIVLEHDAFGRTVLLNRDSIFGSYQMNPTNVADIYEGCKVDEYFTRLDNNDYTNVAAYSSKTAYVEGDKVKSSNLYFEYLGGEGVGHTPPTTKEDNEYWHYLAKTEKSFLKTYFDDAFIGKLRNKEIYNYHYTEAENVPINRSVYLLSYANVASGTDPEGDVAYKTVVENAMNATTNHGKTIKFYTPETSGTGGGVTWWLRSPASASSFSYVNSGGSLFSYNASVSNALRPAFSIASATSITPSEDVGADGKVWLLCNDEKPYKELDVSIAIGESENQPKQGKIIADAVNCYDVVWQACNNYGDASPVWVTANADGIVSFTNTSKETEAWKIGVRVTAKSTGSGYVAEPAIVVTF